MDALEMANVYWEHPLTINCSPLFFSLYPLRFGTTPDDTYYNKSETENQWALPQVDAPEGWDITTGSSSIIIAILDSGVDLNHLDLDGKLVAGRNFVPDPPTSNPDDLAGHGTKVAGIAAAETNNTQGVAGVSWGAKIMPIKIQVLGVDLGNRISNAMEWAEENGADVLSNSWGILGSLIVKLRIADVRAKGVVVVAAAGNLNRSRPAFPALVPGVICVIASNRCDERKRPLDDDCNNHEIWGSNYGFEADVSAPGIFMFTTELGGGYVNNFNGTSAATPMVAGLVALILSVDSDLTPSQVQAIIQFTADDEVGPPLYTEDTPGRDIYTGYGRINVDKALQLASVSPIIRLEDGEGTHVLSFDIEGNFVIEDDIMENASATELTTASTDLWVLRDGSDNVVGRVEFTWDAVLKRYVRNMYLKGTFSEKVSVPSPTNPIQVFKDKNGVTVAFIDENGDLELMGSAFIGADPDRASSQGN